MSKEVIDELQHGLTNMETVKVVVNGKECYINILAVDEMDALGYTGGILSFYFVKSPESDA